MFEQYLAAHRGPVGWMPGGPGGAKAAGILEGRTNPIDSPHVRRHLTQVKTIVSSKGQLVLPAPLRQQDRIRAGQEFDIERIEVGQYLLKRRPAPDNEGLVDWLLACPDKDWFEPIGSESTDSL